MLIVGAGVIGTVYGDHVAAAGSKVSVLSHEPRTGQVAATRQPVLLAGQDLR
jgi:pyruvate/2-oxoglutarate dehydrogenase complex dihydrolipoamide dehydrogenase (E3) component